MRPNRPVTLIAVILLAALTGCARGVDFDSDPGQTYAVNVVNTFSEPMIISFDDGNGARLLGTVEAGRSERFVVAGTAGGTISVIARDEADTRTVRRTVTLVPGGTVEVRLN